MQVIKDTARARVERAGCGSYTKWYRHHNALARFWNEVQVLQHLERSGCAFVPRLLDYCVTELSITTSNAGTPAQHLSAEDVAALYRRLEEYGVQHDDPELRNITFDAHSGEFCVIDFEFATLLNHCGSDEVESRLDSVQSLLHDTDA